MKYRVLIDPPREYIEHNLTEGNSPVLWNKGDVFEGDENGLQISDQIFSLNIGGTVVTFKSSEVEPVYEEVAAGNILDDIHCDTCGSNEHVIHDFLDED